jgi:hypothetical protein
MLGEQLEATTTDFADSIAIADVAVADRHRKNMGDIARLAASTAAIGLLNPITVDENGQSVGSRAPTQPIIANSEPRAVNSQAGSQQE